MSAKNNKTMILIFTIIGLIGLILAFLGFSQLIFEITKPALFTVVCDGHGRYSYVDIGDEISEKTFPDRESAEREADYWRAWLANYENNREGIEAVASREKAARRATFKPSP